MESGNSLMLLVRTAEFLCAKDKIPYRTTVTMNELYLHLRLCVFGSDKLIIYIFQ